MKKIYNEITKPFSVNQIQNGSVLLKRIHDYGFSIEEFLSMVQEEMEREKIRIGKNAKFRKKERPAKLQNNTCPKCAAKLLVQSVNSRKCNQVGGDYKFLDTCTAPINKCNYTQLR